LAQQYLFPLKIRIWHAGNIGGADNQGVAILDNGEPCLIKENTLHKPWICANEWICNRLAEDCAVPAPPVRVVTMDDGTHAVGIRMDSDALTDLTQNDVESIHEKLCAIHQQPEFSRIAFFDVAVKNVDRHLNNYLVRKNSYGVSLVAIDYSRALLTQNFPPPDFSAVKASPTGRTWDLIAGENDISFNVSEANITADNICNLDRNWMKDTIERMPKAWMNDELGARLHEWFLNERHTSIHNIQGFFHTGASQ